MNNNKFNSDQLECPKCCRESIVWSEDYIFWTWSRIPIKLTAQEIICDWHEVEQIDEGDDFHNSYWECTNCGPVKGDEEVRKLVAHNRRRLLILGLSGVKPQLGPDPRESTALQEVRRRRYLLIFWRRTGGVSYARESKPYQNLSVVWRDKAADRFSPRQTQERRAETVVQTLL